MQTREDLKALEAASIKAQSIPRRLALVSKISKHNIFAADDMKLTRERKFSATQPLWDIKRLH